MPAADCSRAVCLGVRASDAVLEQLARTSAIPYGTGSRMSSPVQSVYGDVFKLPNSHFLLFKMEIALKIVFRNDSHGGLG